MDANHSIVTSNGEVKIPDDILAALALRPGDKIEFNLLASGMLILRPKNKSILDMAGMLYEEGRPAVPIDKMSPWA